MLITFVLLVLAVAAVVFLFQLIMSLFDPYKMTAIANAQAMRSAMEEACVSGQAELQEFQLPQNTMEKLFNYPVIGKAAQAVAKYQIRLKGDPTYILYYEAFPPGKGYTWEWYDDRLTDRNLIYLDDGYDGKNLAEFTSIVWTGNDNIIDSLKKDHEGDISSMVANIVLNDQLNPLSGITAQGSEAHGDDEWKDKNNVPPWGKWDGNFYAFGGYMFLDSTHKSMIKYASWGPNSLCLKTPEGVYRFPLNYCKGVEYVKIVRAPTYLGGLTRVKSKTSDFHIVSPCKISGENLPPIFGGYDNIIEIKVKSNDYKCENTINYPLYEIDENKKIIDTKNDHYSCLDDTNEIGKSYTFKKYIEITIPAHYQTSGVGFCSSWNTEINEMAFEYDNNIAKSDIVKSSVWLYPGVVYSDIFNKRFDAWPKGDFEIGRRDI